ncbi:polyprenyl synthetase family protein [Nocardia sp. BMG51109]|uniref:polyprenyl synthetase family protein n=1 Tax=Nocardia sp. BMG51109 TaxID=1056816 RepID=UPI000467912D|nr:polyprenyl synthetase family protein [Nocardia sp. BMG51109]
MIAAEPDADPFTRARRLITPGLRAAADRVNSATRQVIGYHFGWWDEQGNPLDGNGGKALRPVLAMLAAEAVGGTAERATNAAVAVELAHNFSLLHDDIMDADRTRRHRPTAWTVFGVPAAILAGDTLTTLATEALVADGPPLAVAGVSRLDEAILRLNDGQAADLAFEGRADVPLDECVTMARDKTSALFAAACELGAMSAGASPQRVWQLRQFGEHLGLVFQLVDDLQGIWGDPAATGKPVMADLRARKKSLPVVAAFNGGNGAAARLAELYLGDEPLDDDALRTCADLIAEAGAQTWAHQEIQRRLDSALACLHAANPEPAAAAALATLARQLSTGPRTSLAAQPESYRMPTFELRPARLSPHLDSARAHALTWARDMGLFAPQGGIPPWTEEQFRKQDYPLLLCHMFPDVPADKVDTLVDWCTWLFYLDDFFAETCRRTGDAAPTKAHRARLRQFMPLDPTQDVPVAASPTERCLTDLWLRTVPAMSREWRCRTRELIEECLGGNLRELRNATSGHPTDPIEYLELKRRTNAGPLAASLAEYGRAAELPGAVADAPPIRSLIECLGDASLLVNDLYSYPAEVASGAEPANMVHVLRKFLGCDLQRAVDTTADLVRSRLDRFEHVAGVEVPTMLEEYGLSPADSADVLEYIDVLRDSVPGWHAWFERTARYSRGAVPAHDDPATTRRLAGPTGLGTSTARQLRQKN